MADECKLDWCSRKAESRDLCNRHYERWRTTGNLSKSQHEKTPAERFWEKVNKTDGCWLWTAGLHTSGNAQFGPGDGRNWLAHRYSYLLHFGELPDGLDIRRTCDNLICVRPEHLEAVAAPTSQVDRFWSKVDADGDCWVWMGHRNRDGYGRWKPGPGQPFWLTHRWSYTSLVGEIPDGLVIDHLCKNPPCVNPDHLEPVAQAVNVARGAAGQLHSAKTHCPKNHPYAGDNLKINARGRRECRECLRVTARLAARARRAARKAAPVA